MKKILSLILPALMALSCLAALNMEITPGVLLFKTTQPISVRSDRTGLTAFDSYLDQLGASNIIPISGMHTNRYYQVNIAVDPDWTALKNGQYSFTGIEYAQPNFLRKMHLTPNDPLYPLQFHHITSNPQAWNYSTGSSLIVVGIVDSGLLFEHPDLNANIWINQGEIPNNGIDDDGNGYIDDWWGWDFSDAPEMSDVGIGDFTGQDNDPTDENYHGTHVAGIVGAVGNNGIGISGVAWNVKLMAIRAGFRTTQGQGYLQDDDAAAAIIYAADNGCHVLNLSWGDPNYSAIIADACQYAYDKGVTIVASAGNDPGPILSYPARLSTVISVGAVNKTRNLAGFSSYGVDLELVAPGEQILSTYKLEAGEQYFEQSGTSMSSPFVVGAVALLLSLHPGLSPDQVRSRLLNSTDDLGAPGFDQFYGHGLLNSRKLLENTNPPLVTITDPQEFDGVSDSFDIVGTVQTQNFFRYSVMYSTKNAPSSLDWMDVTNHTNLPVYHTAPVTNGTLAHFYLPELMPEGKYLIRIQYENMNGGKYNYYRTVQYDYSAPWLVQNSLQNFKRYDKQNLRYYISAKFNEPVRTELKIIAADGSIFDVYGIAQDSLHVWAVPPQVSPGSIDISVKATNKSNLSIVTPLYPAFMNIVYESVPNYGFQHEVVGSPRVPLAKTFDYNGDGSPEYVAMDLPISGYGNVFAFQPEAGGHVVKHNFNDSFWLLGAGNTNNLGQELLTLRADRAILLETIATQTYPGTAIWEEGAITGGILADYSGDGVDDILLVKNLPAERVIQLYKRSAAGVISAKNTLRNTTSTNLRNTFVPSIIVKNFDTDNQRDILTADTDGDIMMFEVTNDNLHEMSWTTRLPVGNTYQLTSGDYDGNGRQDFFVGGYYRDILNPNLNFWYFEGFKFASNNNYTSMGSIMFNEVLSQNSVQSFDLDNDGKDEIILAISPNLYVLKYINGQFKPVFSENSFRSYTTLAYKDANNRAYFITNYKVSPDSIAAVQWTAEDPFTGPPAPANLLCVPLDHQRVKLTWVDNTAASFRIYRKDDQNNVILIDNVLGNVYEDSGLVSGKTYRYTITAVNHSFSPPESIPLLWQTAIPNPLPVLVSIDIVGSKELRLIFDQQMSNDALNPGCYNLDHNMGIPLSVNSIFNHYGLQVRFRQAFPAITEMFTLALRNVKGITGVALPVNSYTFAYVADVEAPKISEVKVLPGEKSVQITFNEEIMPAGAIHPLNYQLHLPSNDLQNSIDTISHNQDVIIITLNSKLKPSSSAYYLTVHNLSDLFGNTISPQHNIARFALTNIKNLKNLTVYPNPVKPSLHQSCAFINFPAGKKGNISIYDTSGALVFSSAIGPFNPEINNITWRWNISNNSGRKVSSGIYFYVVEMDGEIARGKLAVLR
ncbi:MAG: S8 family serine peptidase [Candidatus Cloacimonadaceae bacterium]|nr:S8 family serine peptidase [Candidatus Cloacimonadaceae bacterium]MDP3115347.1 S8 family serine peptidase [Candidatus Cloacimonadaceae bacterium]